MNKTIFLNNFHKNQNYSWGKRGRRWRWDVQDPATGSNTLLSRQEVISVSAAASVSEFSTAVWVGVMVKTYAFGQTGAIMFWQGTYTGPTRWRWGGRKWRHCCSGFGGCSCSHWKQKTRENSTGKSKTSVSVLKNVSFQIMKESIFFREN